MQPQTDNISQQEWLQGLYELLDEKDTKVAELEAELFRCKASVGSKTAALQAKYVVQREKLQTKVNELTFKLNSCEKERLSHARELDDSKKLCSLAYDRIKSLSSNVVAVTSELHDLREKTKVLQSMSEELQWSLQQVSGIDEKSKKNSCFCTQLSRVSGNLPMSMILNAVKRICETKLEDRGVQTDPIRTYTDNIEERSLATISQDSPDPLIGPKPNLIQDNINTTTKIMIPRKSTSNSSTNTRNSTPTSSPMKDKLGQGSSEQAGKYSSGKAIQNVQGNPLSEASGRKKMDGAIALRPQHQKSRVASTSFRKRNELGESNTRMKISRVSEVRSKSIKAVEPCGSTAPDSFYSKSVADFTIQKKSTERTAAITKDKALSLEEIELQVLDAL